MVFMVITRSTDKHFLSHLATNLFILSLHMYINQLYLASTENFSRKLKYILLTKTIMSFCSYAIYSLHEIYLQNNEFA